MQKHIRGREVMCLFLSLNDIETLLVGVNVVSLFCYTSFLISLKSFYIVLSVEPWGLIRGR